MRCTLPPVVEKTETWRQATDRVLARNRAQGRKPDSVRSLARALSSRFGQTFDTWEGYLKETRAANTASEKRAKEIAAGLNVDRAELPPATPRATPTRRLESVAAVVATVRADLDAVIERQTQGAAGLAALRERIDRIEDRLDRLGDGDAEAADGP